MTEETDPLSFDIFVGPVDSLKAVAFIYIKDLNSHKEGALASVKITDWEVSVHDEGRGIGSMLLREAILECRHRGVSHITGDLVDGDEDHFEKLKYIYTKHGFTVDFFDADTINRNPNKYLGKVELTL